MTRRTGEIDINDFSGGLHSSAAITELDYSEAYDLSNLVIGPNGDYIRSKNGNSTFNASAMNSSANVQSLSYYKLIAGTEFLVSICGNKIYSSTSLDGTMNDITGAVTITGGQNNIWTFLTFNNVHIGFGGISTSPDAPIQYTGTGNAAALSGTPPSAYGCVQANNRVFAFRTAASPSIVQWCILGNPQDWTGTGSGSQTISTSDNDSVTALAVMDNSTILIFKQKTIHKMMVNTLVSGAFPVFPLFKNVGCAGKHALVVADGLCYFLTPEGDMKITDGDKILTDVELPKLDYVSNLWSAMNSSRYEYVQGRRVTAQDYDHILWLMTSTAGGTTHDVALRWDIKNRCWLRDLTGYKANVITTTSAGSIYTGNYSGLIFKQDVTTVTTEASEGSLNLDSYWTSGWQKFGSFDVFKSIVDFYISYVTQSFGSILLSWGYDFSSFARTEIISQISSGGIYDQSLYDVDLYGGQTDKISKTIPYGNGRVFQYRIRNTDFKMKINSMNLFGKKMAKQQAA